MNKNQWGSLFQLNRVEYIQIIKQRRTWSSGNFETLIYEYKE